MVNVVDRPSEAVRPGDTVDRYVVEARLGEGGAAVVFRVRHRDLGTRHALKILRIPGGDPAERLIREGRIQATLKHPNIVAVTDVLRIGSFPALVMEHVPGLSLEQLLARYRPDAAEIDALARDILAGMGAAHDQGLVHRDLKPANVLLELGRSQVVAKISDFGLARVIDEAAIGGRRSTRSGVTMGTPAFMAPEQLRSARDVDHRADVFALGALLYELVSGVPAFGGNPGNNDDLVAIYLASSKGGFRPLDEVAPDARPQWVDAVHAALRPDPADRPQTVAELVDRWIAGSEPPWPTWNTALLRSLSVVDTPSPTTPSSLVEIHTTTATLIPVSPPPPLPTPWAPLVFATTTIAVMFAGTLALSVAAVFWMSHHPPAALPVAEVITIPAEPRAARVRAPEQEPLVVASAPVVVVPERPRPVVVVAEAPSDVPAPAASPVVTTLAVAGIERAWLEDPAGRRLRPGPIPPGSYALYVFFDAAKPTRVMSLTLADGERRLVRCDPFTRICK